MIVGDMEGLDLSGSLQSIDDSIIADNLFKSKQRNEDLEKIRRDVIEIVAGMSIVEHFLQDVL